MTMSGAVERGWGWLNGLSLDVSLGALGLSLLSSHGLQVSASYPELIGLWSAVSLIYSLDHLLDARRYASEVADRRRSFHQERLTSLQALSGLSALIGALCLPWLQRSTLWVGSALALCCGLYLWRAQGGGRPLSSSFKKATVALIFPLGVLTPSLIMITHWEGTFIRGLGLLSVSVLSVTLANLILFEVAERRALGAPLSNEASWRRRLNALALCPLLGLMSLIWTHDGRRDALGEALGLLALIGLIHIALNVHLERWLEGERYRRMADGAFLISWLALLL